MEGEGGREGVREGDGRGAEEAGRKEKNRKGEEKNREGRGGHEGVRARALQVDLVEQACFQPSDRPIEVLCEHAFLEGMGLNNTRS